MEVGRFMDFSEKHLLSSKKAWESEDGKKSCLFDTIASCKGASHEMLWQRQLWLHHNADGHPTGQRDLLWGHM
eukprot:1314346-Ditylum_brightwellii.AAC.1